MLVPQGVVVTCSGLNKTVKEQVKLLVERMAGIYSSSFHDGVTHLVTVKVCALHWFVIAGLHGVCCFRLSARSTTWP